MEMITLTIDGVQVSVPKGTTVLEAARQAGVKIPTLCYLKDINAIGSCRICLVDVGARTLMAACTLPATDGMNVNTRTSEVLNARKINLELILSNHDKRCLTCIRSNSCELQTLSNELGVSDLTRYEGSQNHYDLDLSSDSIVRDNNKCIVCRRCVATCANVQQIGVIGAVERGFATAIESPFKLGLGDVPCINCGQCIEACPVGALYEKDDTQKVWDALNNPAKHVVVQTAPSVRVALGEEFGMPIGTRVTGKMATALHRLGFDKVFDTDFSADLTIIEEGHELLGRLKNGGKLPMITSCSPGWVKYCEHFYPEFLDNLSSCKSPQQMMGAMIKSYYAQKNGIDPKDIVSVSVMPCTAKKFEAGREEMADDIDIAITTRELASMIKQAGIDFVSLPDGEFDDILGESTGAGVIFGATGGVMEAALRTVYEVVTGKTLERLEFCQVRGIEGIKEAVVDLDGTQVRVAVANGTGNAKKLLDSIKSGEKEYDFIEIMACPGGCVNGGGQPIVSAQVKAVHDVRVLRASQIYAEDEAKTIRKSHDNPAIKRVYEEFLGEPNGHKAHELLHTHYKARIRYTK
ncbi:MAG: NADH-dependent [FeFe] hydrogenase, group A6 [Eubacteriales bacterium]|nr:NADH-dependent [FeFe] hydrogenase, group A6 [Eubacteriales bacterium]